MLGFQILLRATSQLFRHWKYALMVGLPWVCIIFAAAWPLYFYDLRAAPPDIYAFHFPPILPYPWSIGVYFSGFYIVAIWGGISVAIGWHRTLLVAGQTIRGSLQSQPRLRYFLRAFAIMAIAATLAIPLSAYASYQYKIYNAFDILTYQGFSLFWLRIETFVHEYALHYLIAVFSTLIGISLAGIAVGDRSVFLVSIRYAVKNIHHIFVVTSLVFLIYFLLSEKIDLYQFRLEYYQEITTPWRALPFRVLLSWLNLMISIAIVTEFYRDMTKGNGPNKNAAGDTNGVSK